MFEAVNHWIQRAAHLLGMTATLERRGDRRVRTDFTACLSGDCGRVEVRGLDAHRRGLGGISERWLETGSLVFVRLSDLGLAAFAHVRRCEPRPDGNYAIGLEFRDKLTREREEIGGWQYQRAAHGACGVWDAAAD